MHHEIGYGHVAGENKGNHARIRADEEEDAANDLNCVLDVEKRCHLRSSRAPGASTAPTSLALSCRVEEPSTASQGDMTVRSFVLALTTYIAAFRNRR
jgi:hypothetical protein